jgi:site-specific DNA recombinase
MTTRAAIYARISQDDAATGLGVARQEQDCRTLAAAKGWEVGGVFIDNDVSAWKKGKARPEYTKMMEALRAETFNAVVVYNIDRLYRQPRQLEDLIDLCEHGRVGFATCAGEFNLATSPGRTMARVQVTFAIQASDDASRRQRRKMIEVAQRGGAHGGPRAYGVDTVDRAKLNDHEVEVIREVAEAIIGGESVRSQCLKLNARGDLTPRGNQWAVTTLRRLLLSPRIIGKREHIHTGLHDAVAPAIIDELTQTRLRAAMARPARRGAPARHLLSGILH